jgi:exonuclease III
VAAPPDPPAPATWAPSGGLCSAEGGERIDHVLISAPGQSWRVVGQGVVQPRAPFPSDHCPVWAVIARPVDVR